MPAESQITVTVLRGFFDHTRQARHVGEVVSLPQRFAMELIAARKAVASGGVVRVSQPAPTIPPPAQHEPGVAASSGAGTTSGDGQKSPEDPKAKLEKKSSK